MNKSTINMDTVQSLKERISELESQIVDQKQVCERSIESYKQYKMIADNTSDSIAILSFDEQLKYLYVNDSVNNEKGFDPEHLVGKSFFDIVHPDDKENILLKLNRYLKAKTNKSVDNLKFPKVEIFEFRAQTKDGQWRYMRTTVNAIGDNLLTISKDITDIKESERLLKTSKEHSENLLNISAGIIISLDVNGNITLLNDDGYKLLGFKNGTLLGKNWFDICIPLYLKSEIKIVFNDLMSGIVKNTQYYENSIQTGTGDERIIRWHNTLLYDNDKNIVGILSSGQDITDRRNTEIALRESEKRFKLLAKNAIDIIYRYKFYPKPCFDYISPSVTTITGYTPKDHYDNPYLQHNIIHPDDKQHLAELEKGKIPKSPHIARWIRKDGEIRWIEDRNRVVLDENGNIIEVEGIARDITEQVLVQNALKESEEKFVYLFNTSPNVITISNIEDGTIIEINDTGLNILGYKKNEVIGKSVVELGLITKEQRTILIEPLMEKGYYSEIEIPVTLNSGKLVVGLFYGHILSLAGKDYLFQTIVDISTLKILENEVRTSRKKYQDLFDNAPDMHFSVDVNGTVLSVNQGGADYLGYTKNELIGELVWKVVYIKDLANVKHQISQIINTGKKYSDIEFRKIKKDGTIIFVQERIQCIKNTKGKPYELRIVCRDITEIEKTRQRISDYQDSLKSMTYELSSIEDNTKRQIATRLHDDIGQAMALSKITISNISEDMPFSKISKKIDDAKSFLNKAIKSSRDLTYEISPPILHELGLEAAIRWYTDQINKIFDIRFQIIGNKISNSLSENINILLYKSIFELINNIIKHSEATLVTISLSRFKSFIRITVKDNGKGFKNKTWKKLSKDKKFGLFSINERIGYVGGDFKIESEYSKGTKVTIKVPI